MVKYTAARLKRAHAIQRTIESLQAKIHSLSGKLTTILHGGEVLLGAGSGGVRGAKKTGRRKMSRSARAKIAAAAKARWAKAKASGKNRL